MPACRPSHRRLRPLGRDPGRGRRHPAVAAVALGVAEVPARPDRQRAVAAAGHRRPARVRSSTTGSWWSPVPRTGTRWPPSCPTCPATRCSPSRRRATRWPRSGWPRPCIERADPDAVMGSFAADHVIADEAAFARRRTPRGGGRPRRLAGDARHRADAPVHGVRLHPPRRRRCPATPARTRSPEFVEKPAAEVAAEYLATGRYRWNAGMFVVRPRRAARPARAVGTRGSRRRCGRSPPTRPGSRTLWPGAAADRDRPRRRRAGRRRRPGRRRAGRRSAGTTSATSTRWPRCWRPRRAA